MTTLSRALGRLRAAFHEADDPLTGDHLSAGEHVSWTIQHAMRRWSFLGAITLLTLLCWATRNPDVLAWWNYAASFMALVIESIVGMAMFNQTIRDALVTRAVLRMEKEHGEKLNHLQHQMEQHITTPGVCAGCAAHPAAPAASPPPD